MRSSQLITFTSFLLLGGCTPTSEHPLSDQETSTIDGELIGQWILEDDMSDDDNVGVIRRKKSSDRVLEIVDAATDESQDLFCTTIGSERYVCFLDGQTSPARYQITHYELRGPDTVRLTPLDGKRIAAAIRAGKIAGKGIVITAPSDELRAFLEHEGKACFDPDVHLTAKRWRRVLRPGERQLFIDEADVASSDGLTKVWHTAEKFDGNPVLTRGQPWEGKGPYLYGTAIYDPREKLFKLWYQSYVGGRPDYWTCYATSHDGLDWQRPLLDAVSDPRLPDRHNVVMLGSGLENSRQCLSPSVLEGPDERDPGRRYAMTYWDVNAGRPIKYAGLCLAFSPDGIHWQNVPNNPVFEGASDVTDCCYDARRGRYLLHYKIWRVEGRVMQSEGTPEPVGEVSHWVAWDVLPSASGQPRFEGRLVDFSAGDPRPVRAAVEFEREPLARRVVARAESTDLVHWTDARLVFELPEEGDLPGTSTYGMPVFAYERHLLGLLRVMHDERQIDVELAASRDDRRWRRVAPRRPILPLGAGESFDAGMVFAAPPVAAGNELWFYYGAFTGHHAVADADQSIAIGLAKLRRDGFVSLEAQQAGTLLTAPLMIAAGQLHVNADVQRGSLWTMVVDESGEPLPGFERSEAISSDSTDAVISWEHGRLDALRGKPVRLKFTIERGRLFSYWVE